MFLGFVSNILSNFLLQLLDSQPRLFEDFKSLKSSSGLVTTIRNFLFSTTLFGGHKHGPSLDIV